MADRSLYDEDFVRWSKEQAEAIRAAASSGTNLPLDWENLAEEVESLGKALRSELRSRCAIIVEHLLKLQHSEASDPRRGWIETIGRERAQIELLLEDNPGLRANLHDTAGQSGRLGRKLAQAGLERHDELTALRRRALFETEYGVDQILGDWLPGDVQRGTAAG